MTRTIAAAAALTLAAAAAQADIETKMSPDDVATTMDRLEAAVTEAGATVFARVDHAQGAADVGMDLAPAQLLIFGNPQLGTPAMQDDIRAGLALPMKVLVYEGEDGTVIAWEEPEEMFDDLEIDDDADYVDQMTGALDNLTSAAAGE